MELTKSDLQFVMSRCPRDIRSLLKEHAGKVCLAGGFIRATIAGEKVSDIDLFGESVEQLLSVSKDLTLKRKGRYFKTKNAITVLAPPRIPVQFITRWLFNDPVKVMQSFDFTVCQAVIWAEKEPVLDLPLEEVGANEAYIVKFKSAISDNFYVDLAARRLVYTSPVRDEDAGGSMMRVLKFMKRGYIIQAPSLAGVIARITVKVKDSDIPPEKAEYTAEAWNKKIITGLLREVDPMTVIDGVDFVDEHEVLNDEPE